MATAQSHTAQRDGFQARSGCFACGVCERLTRRTAKQGNAHLCPQCDQWTMDENAINDGSYKGDPVGLAKCEAAILALKEKAASLGGSRALLGLEVI